MSNHYHLLVETVDGNLSQGMRQLNGIYTTRFNRRHKMGGRGVTNRFWCRRGSIYWS
jgi:putative transposase